MWKNTTYRPDCTLNSDEPSSFSHSALTKASFSHEIIDYSSHSHRKEKKKPSVLQRSSSVKCDNSVLLFQPQATFRRRALKIFCLDAVFMLMHFLPHGWISERLWVIGRVFFPCNQKQRIALLYQTVILSFVEIPSFLLFATTIKFWRNH